MATDAEVKKLTTELFFQKEKASFYIDAKNNPAVLTVILSQAQKSITFFSDLPTFLYEEKSCHKSLQSVLEKNHIEIKLFSPTIPVFSQFLVAILQTGAFIQPNLYRTHPKTKKIPCFCIIDNKIAFVQMPEGATIYFYDTKKCHKLLSYFAKIKTNICHSNKGIKKTNGKDRDYTY